MHVQVNQKVRRADEPLSSMLSIQQQSMKGRGREEVKLVLSVRGETLLGLLGLLYRYASVDRMNLLPVLIIVNSFAFANTLHEIQFLCSIF